VRLFSILRRSRILKLWNPSGEPFTLLSDEHFQYRRVVNQDLRHLKIAHVTVSSKACRNFQNILFPVNHLDLLIRKDVGAFTRETISFSKTHAAMCQKYALYIVAKNYMRPQFTKTHVRRPDAHQKCPAEIAGITNRMLKFEDIFDRRPLDQDLKHLNRDWRHYAQGKIPKAFERTHKFRRKAA